MFRYSFVLLWLLSAAGSPVSASSADQLFSELSKDFGSVPRGPALQHTFVIRNTTDQTVQISRLRVSCGCVTATAPNSVIRAGEEGVVQISMDTTRFFGIKSVTIYVDFDQPSREEVRLWVRANSRDDVTFTPETLALGQVKRGTSTSATVNVAFRGDGDAKILEIQAESNYIKPTVKEVRRQDLEVVYELTAQLRPDAPIGKWYTDIWVTTSNPSMAKLRVPLTVEIESLLSVSPAVVSLGDVKLGATAERKVIVRGVKPFKITAVEGSDEIVSVKDSANVSKAVHVLTVVINGKKTGAVSRALKVVTDLDGDNSIDVHTIGKIIQ
jgi:hypothetical protein